MLNKWCQEGNGKSCAVEVDGLCALLGQTDIFYSIAPKMNTLAHFHIPEVRTAVTVIWDAVIASICTNSVIAAPGFSWAICNMMG